MITIGEIRAKNNKIIVLGTHPAIIQSILDFDYLCGKKEPSVVGIVGGENGMAKYFWGKGELLVQKFSNFQFSIFNFQINSKSQNKNPTSASRRTSPNRGGEASDSDVEEGLYWFLNVLSGRRALSSTRELIASDISFSGGVYFAENVPEQHSIALYSEFQRKDIGGIGPASVGLVIPGVLKLGPIGGITPNGILNAKLAEKGDVCVLSASGGMTNELISIVTQSGKRLSFALSFGGDRFPLMTPEESFLIAEEDPETKLIVYYGELGGDDEYRIIELRKKGKIKKPAIIHIAGTVASLFPESPQFGHAKAKARVHNETARAKRNALKKNGFIVTEKFSEIKEYLLNPKHEIRISKQINPNSKY